ncbi:hypothetical protein SAMN05216358_1887 [Rhizobium sp. AN5]|nr:hypothetical protein SAMN05216358_1887 [Rhizobium sp. AN5]
MMGCQVAPAQLFYARQVQEHPRYLHPGKHVEGSVVPAVKLPTTMEISQNLLYIYVQGIIIITNSAGNHVFSKRGPVE